MTIIVNYLFKLLLLLLFYTYRNTGPARFQLWVSGKLLSGYNYVFPANPFQVLVQCQQNQLECETVVRVSQMGVLSKPRQRRHEQRPRRTGQESRLLRVSSSVVHGIESSNLTQSTFYLLATIRDVPECVFEFRPEPELDFQFRPEPDRNFGCALLHLRNMFFALYPHLCYLFIQKGCSLNSET